MILFARILLFALCAVGIASAQKLRPPSDFRVKSLGVNSFLLEWKDNATNEDGFQILATLGSGNPVHYQYLNGADRTSYLVIANSIPGKIVKFQVAAYRGSGADRVFSEPTAIVEATAVDKIVFEAPLKITAVALDDSTVRVSWKDISTTESGYFVEAKINDGDWFFVTSIPVQKNYVFTVPMLPPNTKYAVRVTAYKGNGQVVSDVSKVATVTTPPFLAPRRLRAVSEGEGLISLHWRDESSLEDGYEVQYREGGKKFRLLGTVGEDAVSTEPLRFKVGTKYQFRMRGFRTVDGKKEYTGFSNIASKRSLGLARPGKLRIASSSENSVKLRWKDNSEREEGYTVRYRMVGSKSSETINLPANSNTCEVSGLQVGRDYEFRVRAFEGKKVSRYSDKVRGGTRDRFVGDFEYALTTGVSFFEEIRVSRTKKLVSMTVSGLPAGLRFDPVERTVFGVAAAAGEYRATVQAKFDGYTILQELVFRIVAQQNAPEAERILADVTLKTAVKTNVNLAGAFRDSDVSLARRFVTNLGTFDVVLYEEATPLTVENFLAYADAGFYQDTFFHRAPTGFVVQGGGFTYNASGFGRVATFDPVRNEPGISNLSGTIAMAKLGGDPDSATSQFFINLSDENAPNLDAQNGGFTVFGRIAGNGMDLFNEIDSLPKGTYSIDLGTGPISLDDLPVNVPFPAPSVLDPETLVRVSSVTTAPVITHSVVSLAPSVATATVSGNLVEVTGVSPGSAQIRVRATDLDGLFADQIFTVTVE